MGRTQQESRALKEMENLTGVGGGERNREQEKQRASQRQRNREREGKSISECVCVIGRGWYPQLRERVGECRHGVDNYDVMKISFPLIS